MKVRDPGVVRESQDPRLGVEEIDHRPVRLEHAGSLLHVPWLVRVGLIGYAATTILGWAIMGPDYSTAYVTKAIEVALIVLVAIDFVRFDGSPVAKIRTEIAAAFAWLKNRRAEPAGLTASITTGVTSR